MKWENVNSDNQSTSSDLKKIAPSSDAFNIRLLTVAHIAEFEWIECLHNASMPDPLAHGHVLKGDM